MFFFFNIILGAPTSLFWLLGIFPSHWFYQCTLPRAPPILPPTRFGAIGRSLVPPFLPAVCLYLLSPFSFFFFFLPSLVVPVFLVYSRNKDGNWAGPCSVPVSFLRDRNGNSSFRPKLLPPPLLGSTGFVGFGSAFGVSFHTRVFRSPSFPLPTKYRSYFFPPRAQFFFLKVSSCPHGYPKISGLFPPINHRVAPLSGRPPFLHGG